LNVEAETVAAVVAWHWSGCWNRGTRWTLKLKLSLPLNVDAAAQVLKTNSLRLMMLLVLCATTSLKLLQVA
jgi:hypothetical protein